MKILIITDSFPPESIGGSGQVAYDLSIGLKQSGQDVSVITASRGSDSVGDDFGIPVYRLHSTVPSKFWRSYRIIRHSTLKAPLVKLVSNYKPDIIHFHNVNEHFSYASMSWAAHAAPKAKIFFTAHDPISFAYTRLYHFIDSENLDCRTGYNYKVPWTFLFKENKRAYNPFRNILIGHYLRKYVRKIFCVSNALGNAFKQNGISNVMTIYNGVSSHNFQADQQAVDSWKSANHLDNKKIIFFGGRAISDKGTEQLLKAMPDIIKIVPEAVLVMAMENNSYAKHFRNLIGELGLGNYVKLVGLLSGRDLASAFSAADVVSVPSIYFDPAPLMNLQAMSAGKPVVGTCFGGTPEIVRDKIDGFIVNPYDVKSLADKISLLLSDEFLAQDLGNNGKNRVQEKFTIEHQVRATLDAYASL